MDHDTNITQPGLIDAALNSIRSSVRGSLHGLALGIAGLNGDTLDDDGLDVWLDNLVDPIMNVATARVAIEPLPALPIKPVEPPREALTLDSTLGDFHPTTIDFSDVESALTEFNDIPEDELSDDERDLRESLTAMYEFASGNTGTFVDDNGLDDWIDGEHTNDIPAWIAELIDWPKIYDRIRSNNPRTFDLDGFDYRWIPELGD